MGEKYLYPTISGFSASNSRIPEAREVFVYFVVGTTVF